MVDSANYLHRSDARTIETAPFDEISYQLCARRKDVIMVSADLSKEANVI